MTEKITRETKGSRLKKLIQSRGMMQKEFAEAVGVSDQMVTLYVQDKSCMSPTVLVRAMEVLSTSMDYLLLRSDVDMPERNAQMVKAVPWSEEQKKYNRQFYRTGQALKMLKAQGVRITATITIGKSTYVSQDWGPWTDEEEDSVDYDQLLDQIRSDPKKATYDIEVAFLGSILHMDETEYQSWLLSIWNCQRAQLHGLFRVTDPITTEVVDTPMARALKGLPDMEE